MSGLGMENAEEIILDAKNNTYNGPRGLFTIVVDEFDGTTISSWHIEDTYGEKSRNLGSAKCKTLDAVVGKVGAFLGKRVSVHIYKKALAKLK
jgi:hypothetical protein